ncbi:MAG: hypothetical protein WC384_06955 [Prolixibacteraceae bacterium]|jgi:hypothetical protein
MKKYLVYIFISVFLAACAATNRLHENFNPETQQASLKMEQKLKISHNGNGQKKSSGSQSVHSAYVFRESKKEHQAILVSFGIKPSETNPVIFIFLDNEKFRLDQNKNENETLNSGTIQFEIPENLWVPIVHSEDIRYLIVLNKKETETKPSEVQAQKLKEFFRKAIRLQQLNFPTPPEGMKKW